MIGDFEVRYTEAARQDLIRLFDFLALRAETIEDFDSAKAVIDTIRSQVEGQLGSRPFIFRKASGSPFLRELVIPVRGTGYVALYEIEGSRIVNILALRHQLEDDFH